jgi:hypothetical protein
MTLLPSCREVTLRLSEIRDSGGSMDAVELMHLWFCEHCRRFRDQLKLLGVIVAHATGRGPALSAAAKKRMQGALKKKR